MIINQPGATFTYGGVEYVIGAPVIGTKESEYEGLYGTIIEIRDGDDKETENETPDLYCEFDPPVLPHEIKRLEEIFSDLYDEPKKLDDIILDMVIMAPQMVRPLEDLHRCQKQATIYVVMEDWAVDGEHGNSCELFTDHEDARHIMLEKLREEIERGVILRWVENAGFVVDSDGDSYEGYLEGEYTENHYMISVQKQPLTMSLRYIREVADVFTAQCRKEDFISQVEEWDDVGDFSKDQYQKLINDPSIPDRIEKQLGRNDCYWEAFWESVSEVAHDMVAKAHREVGK